MEIRVLRYFLAVARERNITGAANYLHLTQPTLSRQIHDLEKELGQQLLIRKSHRVELTPEGVLLRKRAEEIIAMVDKTEAEFASMEDTVSGDIYIGSGETQAIRQIAELIKDLGEACPNIHYHLHSGNAEDVMERLDKGMLDFGVLIQPVKIEKYDFVNLPDKDVWGIVMRKDFPLSRKKTIRKEDLSGVPLICSRQVVQRFSQKNAWSDWFGGEGAHWNLVATYNLIYNAALMVEEGVGCAVTLDKLLHFTGSSELCFRPLAPRLESGLNLVWKKNQLFSPAAELFLDRIRRRFGREIPVRR